MDGGVISDVFKSILPATIKKYLPKSEYLTYCKKVFNMVSDIFKTVEIKDKSTRSLLLDTVIKNAKDEQSAKELMLMFDRSDKAVIQAELSMRHKHDIVMAIWSINTPDLEKKEAYLEKLRLLDPNSDWLKNTEKFCQSAHIGNKA